MFQCSYVGKNRFKEWYSPANIDVWIRDLDIEYRTAVKTVWCGKELSEELVARQDGRVRAMKYMTWELMQIVWNG